MSGSQSTEPTLEDIARLLSTIGGIDVIGGDDDFYNAGFSSIGSLELLMQLESRWSISLPDDEFVEARTPRALLALVTRSSGSRV